MPSPSVDLLYHFIPLLAISLAVLINLTVTHWRTEARAALTILQDVYDENLRALDSGREFLLSSRQLTSLYRGNLGRIQLLDTARGADAGGCLRLRRGDRKLPGRDLQAARARLSHRAGRHRSSMPGCHVFAKGSGRQISLNH
jgi:hypothetical protein